MSRSPEMQQRIDDYILSVKGQGEVYLQALAFIDGTIDQCRWWQWRLRARWRRRSELVATLYMAAGEYAAEQEAAERREA
jgi:hypothetical protein